jgi:hypothetical protein
MWSERPNLKFRLNYITDIGSIDISKFSFSGQNLFPISLSYLNFTFNMLLFAIYLF